MSKENAKLQDTGMERSVLAGITTNGADCFFDVTDILSVGDFYREYNQQLFAILSTLVHEKNVKDFDIPNVQAVAKSLGYNDYAADGKRAEYLEAIFDEIGSSSDNTQILAAGIRKLSLARKAYLAVTKIRADLMDITGSEPIGDIISMIEDPIFEFTGNLTEGGSNIISLGGNFKNAMTALASDPQDIVGLPTGFPSWDNAIGGGLRSATVNVVGARPKIGKSMLCINVARNMAENGIPVLYLDTELTSDLQLNRLTSLVTGVELYNIETGKYAANQHERDAVWECQKDIEQLPISHCSVAGQSPQAIMSIARRWLAKNVGFADSGAAKPCLLIYDYIKLMDDGGFKRNLQEYQLLGFLITSLHNFAVKHRLPVLATVQLNRDGVEKEGGEVVSGSDRIIWLCSNFTILKQKTQSELDEDPPSNGVKKLVVTETRFGPGMEKGEYVNVKDQLRVAKLSEGKSFSMVNSIVQSAIENPVQ